ncbi:Cof-type HAD-IIB family hydrolase [Microbacterium sp. H83]|uniref:Cof-type HAD-IIB family hydrolase n=1 Tax=Microbacterium sp. H83 TaxID=1827324 RepID=UPI0007F4834A|nr:HAD family hydrolase [Microbacterium sp. H83]OAN33046.1 hydrolase [Microbacterium sp. H83]
MALRLIATDLDGTLLTSAVEVSPRTRAALDAARARGIHVVPVTARQPIGLRAIAGGAGFDDWALYSNGAYATHLTDGRMLFAEELPSATIRTLAEALRASIPGLLFASVRDGGEGFVAQHGYAEIADLSDHKRDPKTMGGVPLDQVLAAPSLKFVIRHPELAPAALFDALRDLGLTGFEATLSGAPFVEVMAEGVTKATGLARLCAHVGIDRADVVAFGDALNDVEMLRWAGHGVAMADAAPVVQEAADETTTSNDDDGVARVIERMLG